MSLTTGKIPTATGVRNVADSDLDWNSTDVRLSIDGSGLVRYQMELNGIIQNGLTGLGTEIVVVSGNLKSLRGLRGTAGASGTTTIQLELNGTPVSGATLDFTGSNWDADSKAITLAVVAGDRISFKITAVETGSPADLLIEVS